jgi:hypothetical protein
MRHEETALTCRKTSAVGDSDSFRGQFFFRGFDRAFTLSISALRQHGPFLRCLHLLYPERQIGERYIDTPAYMSNR